MRTRSFGTLATGLTLAFALAACAGETEEVDPMVETPAATVPGAATATPAVTPLGYGDLIGGIDNYVGQTITVEAEVDEVMGPMVFKLDDELAAGITDDLLVLSPQAAALSALDDQWLNDRVRVTGTLRRATAVDLERELGWDLTPELEAEVNARPVLVASSVERVMDS